MRTTFSDGLYKILEKTDLGYRAVCGEAESEDLLYLDIAQGDKRKISYIPKNRLEHFDGDVYNADLRRRYAVGGRAGKVISRLFNNDIDPKELTEFSSQYFAELERSGITKDTEWKMSTDFDHYMEKWHFNDNGTLGTSCMRYDECFDDGYFEVYENFGVKILMLMKEGKIAARALIWTDVSITDYGTGHTFMDRVYTNNTSDEELFFARARDEGWVYKVEQSYGNKSGIWIKIDDTYVTKSVRMSVYSSGAVDCEYYPYIDTFSYNDGDDMMWNHEHSSAMWYCEDTGGGRERFNSEWSDWYECDIPEDEAVYSEELNSFIYQDRAIYLDEADTWVPEDYDDVVICECGTQTLERRTVYYNGGYYLNSSVVYSEYHKEEIPYDISVEIDGDYILEDELDEYIASKEDEEDN